VKIVHPRDLGLWVESDVWIMQKWSVKLKFLLRPVFAFAKQGSLLAEDDPAT